MTGVVAVLTGKRHGSFEGPVGYSLEGNGVSVALGDVNGDNKLDIVVASYGAVDIGTQGNVVKILLGNACHATGLTVAHLLGHASTQILPTYVRPLDENTRAVIAALDTARKRRLSPDSVN